MKRKAYVIVFIGILLALEIALRFLGIPPYTDIKLNVLSTPKYALTIDSLYGYGLNNGAFTTTVNEGLSYQATHIDNYRITGPDVSGDTSKEKLDFFGCSITYGFGVDDTSTFPFVIQKQNDSISVSNFAVPGYCTVQVHNQMIQKYHAENPDIVIYAYGDFHIERNVLSKNWQQISHSLISQNYDLKTHTYNSWRFPYATLKNDSLVVDFKKVSSYKKVSKFSVRRISALANTIGYIITHQQTKSRREADRIVTMRLIENMNLLVQSKSGRFIVAFLTKPNNDPIYQFCKENNIETIDMSVPIRDLKYNNHPYDMHPNALAHKIYADSISQYLKTENKWIESRYYH
jgi:hypothetical protein